MATQIQEVKSIGEVVFPSPGTVLADLWGKTIGVSKFSPYSSDWSESIKDDRGRVRLHLARRSFLQGSFKFDDLKKAYAMWVGLPEFGLMDIFLDGTFVKKKKFELPKRGNGIYRWKLKDRLSFLDRFKNINFFNPKDREVRGKKTRMLFVTLTWDPSSCDLETAWSGRKVEKIKGITSDDPYALPNKRCSPENVGDHYYAHARSCPCVSCRWNRWISAMRKKYGKIRVLRNFEAFGEKPEDGKVHADGYPHIHAVLYFEDHEFTVSYRDQNKHFRILRSERDDLANLWQFNADIEACYSVGGAMGYIKKYLLKTYGKESVENVHRINSEKADLTISLLWVFRKQSFAVSGGWNALIVRGVIQTSLENSEDPPGYPGKYSEFDYVWLGVFSVAELLDLDLDKAGVVYGA